MAKRILPPNPSSFMYDTIFDGRDSVDILKISSNGLDGIIRHVRFLIEDAETLVNADRYPRAIFILATAREEIAKAYILLDMCRLGFEKHESTMKSLCAAFYDHVDKFAYYDTVYFGKLFKTDHMRRANDGPERVRILFRNALQKFWPGDDESPDMPHDTYFDREQKLYIEFLSHTGEWHYPDPNDDKFVFDDSTIHPSMLREVKEGLNRLKITQVARLFEPEILAIMNRHFKNTYISEKTKTDEIYGIYRRLEGSLKTELGMKVNEFEESSLVEWPMYHYLRDKP